MPQGKEVDISFRSSYSVKRNYEKDTYYQSTVQAAQLNVANTKKMSFLPWMTDEEEKGLQGVTEP